MEEKEELPDNSRWVRKQKQASTAYRETVLTGKHKMALPIHAAESERQETRQSLSKVIKQIKQWNVWHD